MDYSLLRRSEFDASELQKLPEWDVFISAFNESERVRNVFDAARASQKHWLVHPEYGFDDNQLPSSGQVIQPTSRDEAEFWHQYFGSELFQNVDPSARVCLDSTGFMRPHLMVFLLLMRLRGFERVDVLYADPIAYQSGADTTFTKGAVTEVRQVRGFEGVHQPSTGDDEVLIVGAGYDDGLIRRVAEEKRSARKLQMFGLPSLQPHMYEENRLRAALAEEAVGPLGKRAVLFAAANDPFETASELGRGVSLERSRGVQNIYLSPLSTKAQTLGFAFFYLCELVGGSSSIIFPFAEFYSRETSVGLSRVWLYEMELDWFA